MSGNKTAYIGLGSNLSNPVGQINSAFKALENMTASQVVARSQLYRSKPMGPAEQPDYVNAVAEITTMLEAIELLDQLQQIEQNHGRIRNARRWGPRTLDLDLLLFSTQTIDEARLKVPHPGIAERNFVLYPLHDIAGDELKIPGTGTLAELIRNCPADGLELIESC